MVSALSLPIDLPLKEIAALCEQYQVQELSLFGSALGDGLRPESDIDFLVVFQPTAKAGFLALAGLNRELAELLQRPVDLVPKNGLNSVLRDDVLATATIVYATE